MTACVCTKNTKVASNVFFDQVSKSGRLVFIAKCFEVKPTLLTAIQSRECTPAGLLKNS